MLQKESIVDNNIIPFDPSVAGFMADSWSKRWCKKIQNWLERHADSDWADILFWLCVLFKLAVGLMFDSRTPRKYKLALLSAILYVLSPFDLIPEATFNVLGLTDDAGVLIIVLDLLFNALNPAPDTIWAEIIQNSWDGDEDPKATIEMLFRRLSEMPGNLFRRLQNLVRRWWPSGRDNNSESEPAE